MGLRRHPKCVHVPRVWVRVASHSTLNSPMMTHAYVCHHVDHIVPTDASHNWVTCAAVTAPLAKSWRLGLTNMVPAHLTDHHIYPRMLISVPANGSGSAVSCIHMHDLALILPIPITYRCNLSVTTRWPCMYGVPPTFVGPPPCLCRWAMGSPHHICMHA